MPKTLAATEIGVIDTRQIDEDAQSARAEEEPFGIFSWS